jgi:hypothetical protein
MQGDYVTQNSTSTLAAKTFRIVIQRDFIIELTVIRGFLKADLKYRNIYVKFRFLLRGAKTQIQEMFKNFSPT